MDYTKNYHLPQWEEEDRIQMQDFNQAMSSIEDGITEAKTAADDLPYVVGSYTGDGSTTNRTVNLGFQPRFVIISAMSRATSVSAESLTRFAILSRSMGGGLASITSQGFIVSNNSFQYPQLNVSNTTYGYIAFK